MRRKEIHFDKSFSSAFRSEHAIPRSIRNMVDPSPKSDLQLVRHNPMRKVMTPTDFILFRSKNRHNIVKSELTTDNNRTVYIVHLKRPEFHPRRRLVKSLA